MVEAVCNSRIYGWGSGVKPFPGSIELHENPTSLTHESSDPPSRSIKSRSRPGSRFPTNVSHSSGIESFRVGGGSVFENGTGIQIPRLPSGWKNSFCSPPSTAARDLPSLLASDPPALVQELGRKEIYLAGAEVSGGDSST